ncbi:uncharacterized protein LOC133897773 [Phragmites australis]|uniref:uncharacterized protein LOC133897773 n=1 Tax=Phragmites australis TaxID=29695 RepID=UPI002D7A1FBB|nr:uncharacterized protein LOC133897773 [Phragmites australis]
MAHKGITTPTTLEVTVVSGESILVRSGRALGCGAYAVVHIASSFARTSVDEDADCNGYPYWAEAVRVALPAGARGLDVEICRSQSGDRVESVAAARVPVEDFTVGQLGHLHCLSYRLFDTGRGLRRRNGIVNITVKRLDGGEGGVPPAKAPLPATHKAVDSSPGMSGSCCGVAADQEKPAAGVVIGYPVGFSATGHADGKGCV